MSNPPTPDNPWGQANQGVPGPAATPAAGGYPPPPGTNPGVGGAGYGAPGGASGYPSFQPPVKKTPWGKIGIGCGGLVFLALLAVGGCTIWALNLASEPTDVANQYLEALEEGDFDTARELIVTDETTSEEVGCQADFLLAALEAGDVELSIAFTNRDLTDSEIGEFEQSGIDGAEITGTYEEVQSGEVRPVSVTLVNDGEWLVCRFELPDMPDGN